MTFWWLEPGWKETRCKNCGQKIWPEGDPDWGLCYICLEEKNRREAFEQEAHWKELEERDKEAKGE